MAQNPKTLYSVEFPKRDIKLKRLSVRKTHIWRSDFLVYKFLWFNLNNSICHVLNKIKTTNPVVLDVGCGEKPYRDLFGECRYIGLNYSRDNASPDILGDALMLPIKSNSVDILLCSQVIEHVRVPKLLIEECYRVLKPGGGFILTGPFYWPLHEEPNDYYRFTCYGFHYLLENAGYRSIDIIPDGNDWIQIFVSINLKISKPFFPFRIFLNSLGLLLGKISRDIKSPLNYTITCFK